ncbi:MAG: carbohydrate-binding protein [Cyclobacteriaceae bacterium]
MNVIRRLILMAVFCLPVAINAQDWAGIAVPANPGQGNSWELQSNISDNFNYVSSEGNRPSQFTSKWVASYHNAWTGPGKTQWNSAQAWTNGSQLGIQAQRVPGTDQVYCGIITNKTRIQYPVYFEISAKIMDQTLANAFWLLSPDDTQEIDAMEGYGSSRPDQVWFAERMHLSHHVFTRPPNFQDYQPLDAGSWYYNGGIPWRNDYHRYGCYWKDPWNVEYYIDGQLVRTVSGPAIIDPNGYTNGTGLNKAMDIIIDCENQTDWRPGPTDAELADDSKNIFWVDWMRVYKPVPSSGGGGSGGTNLALNKPATQSSNYNGSLVASNANDGNQNTINHTQNTSNAWWQVDLGSVSDITTIQVYNRTNCCSNRLSNFHVLVSNSPFNSTNLNSTINQSGVGNYFTSGQGGSPTTLNVNRTGRYVRVQLAGSNFLHMQEIVINGTAGSGGGSGGGGGNATLVIEAENFNNTGGTFNDAFAGGPGLGVSQAGNAINYVNRGDWAQYNINVGVAGTYSIQYMISTPSNNAQVQFVVDGNVASTTNVPNNGSWGNYTALSGGSASLSAGSHTIRINASGSNDWQWNLDKVTLVTGSGSRVASSIADEMVSNDIAIYPNPARNVLNFKGSESINGIVIYNLLGAKVLDTSIKGNTIDVSSLSNGIYTIQLTGNNINEIHRVVIKK